MKLAGGIVGLIGGVFAFFSAVLTLFIGGALNPAEFAGAQVIIVLGFSGVFFSFATIILAALSLKAKGQLIGIILIVFSIIGMVICGILVAICMVLCLAGGILCVLEKYQDASKHKKQAAIDGSDEDFLLKLERDRVAGYSRL